MTGRLTRARLLDLYAAAVAFTGTAALIPLLQTGGGPLPREHLAAFLLFALAAAAGELLPIRVREHAGELAISTTFVFAVLLVHGLAPALAVQAAASIAGDVRTGKPLGRAVFNVGQYTLAWSAAGGVLIGLDGQDLQAPGHLPAIALAAVVFFAVNSVLVRTAVALSDGRPLRSHLTHDIAFRAATTGMLIGLAPAIAAVHRLDLTLAVLVVLPVVAIHRAAREAARNAYLATHDALTGMPNRELFRRRVQAAIADAPDSGRPVAVVMMDIDRFKEINDTLGHHHGDGLLMQVGSRLQTLIGDRGLAARLGGDEFAMLLRPAEATVKAAIEAATPVLDAFDSGFVVDGVALDVGASIGVALHGLHGDDVEALMQRADNAMYRAKQAQASIEAYDPGSDDNTVDRLAMVTELRHALTAGELELHYQPKLCLPTGAVEEVEALVRWRHPVRGLIPPGDFIPLAEHTGLIRPMTKVILDQALSQCAAWRAEGLPVRVAVNLSARSLLDGGLPNEVRRLLSVYRLMPQDLVLEITESVLMADPERSARILEALADMGVSLAIDDFGIGYSSLSYLKRLPVHELKIDRSFVSNLARDPDDALIVRSTVEMARGLRLKVVAEGVEDDITLQRLRAFGTDVAQGHGIARPLPAPALGDWLRAHRGAERNRTNVEVLFSSSRV